LTVKCVRLPDVAYDEEVQRIEADLHNDRWADHTSLERELRGWARLAREIGTYTATVDDYTNDLCGRDYLDAVMAHASVGLRSEIDGKVAEMDETFRQGTVEDVGGILGQFYRVERKDGWWWRRTPLSGPLADYLASTD